MASNLAPSHWLVNVVLIALFLVGGCANSKENGDDLVDRAQQAKQAEQFDEAQQLAERALEEGKKIHQTQQILADLARRRAAIAVEQDNFADAHQAYVEASELEPSRARRADDLLDAIDAGRNAGMVDADLLPLAVAAVDGRPHDQSLRREIARIAEDQGDRTLAIEHYLWLFSADPDDTRSGLRLGVLYLADDRPADAASVLRRVVDADPDNTQAALNLARALAAISRHDEAAQLYSELSERFPENPAILRQFAAFEEERGNYRRARQLREKAEQAQPGLEPREMRPLQ